MTVENELKVLQKEDVFKVENIMLCRLLVQKTPIQPTENNSSVVKPCHPPGSDPDWSNRFGKYPKEVFNELFGLIHWYWLLNLEAVNLLALRHVGQMLGESWYCDMYRCQFKEVLLLKKPENNSDFECNNKAAKIISHKCRNTWRLPIILLPVRLNLKHK